MQHHPRVEAARVQQQDAPDLLRVGLVGGDPADVWGSLTRRAVLHARSAAGSGAIGHDLAMRRLPQNRVGRADHRRDRDPRRRRRDAGLEGAAVGGLRVDPAGPGRGPARRRSSDEFRPGPGRGRARQRTGGSQRLAEKLADLFAQEPPGRQGDRSDRDPGDRRSITSLVQGTEEARPAAGTGPLPRDRLPRPGARRSGSPATGPPTWPRSARSTRSRRATRSPRDAVREIHLQGHRHPRSSTRARPSIVDDVGHERLVLTACHPLYSAAQRYAVFADLVGTELKAGQG